MLGWDVWPLSTLTNRLPDHVHDPAQRGLPHRDGDGRARVHDLLPAHQPLRAVHGDGAARALAEVLRHFEDQAGRWWWEEEWKDKFSCT